MADSLHSRIAAILADNWPAPWHGSDRQHKQVFDLTDTVMAALGLEKDFGCSTAGHHGCRCSHRYVTEWVCEVNDGG